MPAYVVVHVKVKNPDRYEDYKKLAPVSIRQYGGRYLTRGGATEVLEGNWIPERLVILEFPTMERAKDWWNSSEYSGPKALRHATAESTMVLLEGLDVQP